MLASMCAHLVLLAVLMRSASATFVPDTTQKLMDALTFWDGDASQGLATYGAVGTWDVTAVDDFMALCKPLANFNEDLTGWHSSGVTDMEYMFNNASSFDQPLSFDTSSVKDISHMFYGASAFNRPLPFDTSKVYGMGEMFRDAHTFNQPLALDTRSVADMSCMFIDADAFNQPLTLDTSKVTTMTYMLNERSEERRAGKECRSRWSPYH